MVAEKVVMFYATVLLLPLTASWRKYCERYFSTFFKIGFTRNFIWYGTILIGIFTTLLQKLSKWRWQIEVCEVVSRSKTDDYFTLVKECIKIVSILNALRVFVFTFSFFLDRYHQKYFSCLCDFKWVLYLLHFFKKWRITINSDLIFRLSTTTRAWDYSMRFPSKIDHPEVLYTEVICGFHKIK